MMIIIEVHDQTTMHMSKQHVTTQSEVGGDMEILYSIH